MFHSIFLAYNLDNYDRIIKTWLYLPIMSIKIKIIYVFYVSSFQKRVNILTLASFIL